MLMFWCGPGALSLQASHQGLSFPLALFSFRSCSIRQPFKLAIMKKAVGFCFLLLAGFWVPANAQKSNKENGLKKVWNSTKNAGKAVGNKTAEVVSKGAAAVSDKKSDKWVGPKGETIYLDNQYRFYWVNNRGKRVYVADPDLKAKPKTANSRNLGRRR